MGKVILVASGNGGSGKTTFAVNIAAFFAAQGKSCLVLDLNIGLRNADIYMGLENSVIFDLGDVVTGVCGIEKAIVTNYLNPNLSLLSCPHNKEISGFGEGHVKALYSLLRGKFDYILVDAPAGLGTEFCSAASGADSAVIVLLPDFLSLRSADALDKRLEALGVSKRCCILNKVDQSSWGSEYIPGLEDVTRTLHCPLMGVVPYDQNIHIANNSGESVLDICDDFTRKMFVSIAESVAEM